MVTRPYPLLPDVHFLKKQTFIQCVCEPERIRGGQRQLMGLGSLLSPGMEPGLSSGVVTGVLTR